MILVEPFTRADLVYKKKLFSHKIIFRPFQTGLRKENSNLFLLVEIKG